MDARAPDTLAAELLRTMPLGVAVLDRDLRYLAHNTAWLVAHGEPTDRSLVGELHYDIFPIRAEWREVHRRCLAGATEDHQADFFDTVDGERELLRWRVAPWRTAQGEIGGLTIYTERITDQVDLQRQLSEQEGLVRAQFELSPVGLNLCTLDGLWLRSNPAFLSIIGYTQEEADGGLTYWQLTPAKYAAEEEAQLSRLRTEGRYGPYEKEFIHKDGRLVPVRLSGFLVERKGVSYIWSLIEDLTAQRALEARVAEEQVKAIHVTKLATMGEMAAAMAHEINNPLAIIGAYAFTLQDAVAEGDTAHVAEAVEAIGDAVSRAGSIVQGLLRFARAGDGSAAVDVEVPQLVESAMALCRARARVEGVALAVEVATAVTVRGHAIELSQVLVNLLNNALDAVRATAEPAIRIVASDEGDRVRIRVIDSGPGVPDGVDVFGAFVTTKPEGAGTGLGLSISRGIVERHGGHLTLEARSPTTFMVELPR